VQLGLVPVFVDSDPVTLAMDLEHAARMVGPKTVGLMLIHVLGCPSAPASAFCERHGLTLIEDCCEAMGADVGREGLLSTYSHFFSHQLTTMEGGTVTTDDDAIADDLRSMRAHGWTRNRTDKATWQQASDIDPSFLFVTTGYNVRPLEIEGVMGLVQLQHLDADLAGRRAMVKEMRSASMGSSVSVLGYRDHGRGIYCDIR
jgi:CDP-6-deoxy-D-xylo-4-hexulose-3-dehydrase